MAQIAAPASAGPVYHLSTVRKPAVESIWKLPPSPTAVNGSASVLKFPSLADQTDMVKVIVGGSVFNRTWIIHEHLLTAVSDFARVALLWGGKEQEEKIITLPEEDPWVFEFFVKYVYTSIIGVPTLDRKLHLYVLADRLQATELCRKIHISLESLFDTFSNAQLEYVMANTAPGDVLRHSCLDKLSRDMSFKAMHFPTDFSTILCKKYASEILAKMMGKYDAIIMAPSQSAASSTPSSPFDKGKKSIGFSFAPTAGLPQGQFPLQSVPPFKPRPSPFGHSPARTTVHSNIDTNSGSGLFRVPVASTTTTSSPSIFGPRPIQQSGKVANSSTALEVSTPAITTSTSVSMNSNLSSGSVSATTPNASNLSASAMSAQPAAAEAAAPNEALTETSLTASTPAQTSNLTANSPNLTMTITPTPA